MENRILVHAGIFVFAIALTLSIFLIDMNKNVGCANGDPPVHENLKGHVFSTNIDNFVADAKMKIDGYEYAEDNYWHENFTCNISIPSENKEWNFEARGLRVRYHLQMRSLLTENFGLIPPYVQFGYVWWAREFHPFEMSTTPLVGEYGKLGGVSMTGWKIENYWFLSGTIVKGDGDNIMKTYDVYTFILENEGSMGSSPSGTGYADIAMRLERFKMNILSDVLSVFDESGFWGIYGDFLEGYWNIIKGVRENLEVYVP